MTVDIGTIRKVDGTWYVIPENMPYRSIELHPLDVESFSKGYALVDPNGLSTTFTLSYIMKRKSYNGRRDCNMYAKIISEEEYNTLLG